MSSIRVFLLGSLAERGPMHGHQLRLLAEREHVHLWTDFHVGGIYGALNRLQGDGLIAPVRTERDGARPERQILAITDAGRSALDDLQRAALADFGLRPDPFDLAMTRLAPERLDELPAVLGARRAEIAARLAGQRAKLDEITPLLSLAERHVMRHGAHRLQAELAWLDEVITDLPAILADETTREVD